MKPDVVLSAENGLICLILPHNGPVQGGSACFCQIMACSAAVVCTEMPSHSREPGNIRVRARVSFTTGAVRSAILATAGLLVPIFDTSTDTMTHRSRIL